MKICPKCGEEFKGASCPKCTGPEILVNNNDYLQRRKAYEEKQAKLKESASSSDKAEKESIEQVFNKLKENGSAAAKKVGSKTKKSGLKETKESQETAVKNPSARQRKKNKKLYIIASLILTIIVLGAASFGIYKLITRKDYTLYMSYKDKIYNVSNLESRYVCELSDAVFAADKKTFYKAEWPDLINKEFLSESCVSQNGEYFSAVTYVESTAEYSIYVWNKDGCYMIASDKLEKHIKSVTDSGVVIYTAVEVVNSEGYTGATSLYVCKTNTDKSLPEGSRLTGNNTKVESALRSANIYAENNLIICCNSSNRLYTYDYKKNTKTSVSDYVDNLYLMSSDNAYYYTSQVADENLLPEAESFIYSSNGILYYYNLDKKSVINIGKVSGTNISFIYDKKNSCIYMIGSGAIQYSEIKDNAVGKFTELDKLGAMLNMIYLSDDNKIVYVNKNNQLMSISKGNTKVIEDKVTDGSLSKVGNTDRGITYIADGIQFYRADTSSSKIMMHSIGNVINTSATYLYKNRLYFYNDSKDLYSCTKKGTDSNKIGQVDNLWLGTE